MLGKYKRRSILALTLMVAQSFLYNSVFFTFGLVLAHFYHVPEQRVGLYLLPLALGNFCGPLCLGSLFDTIGRKKMIAGTFATSGILLFATAYLFAAGWLSAVSQTIAWVAVFFFASAAAVRLISPQAKYFRWKLGPWRSRVSMRWALRLVAARPRSCLAGLSSLDRQQWSALDTDWPRSCC